MKTTFQTIKLTLTLAACLSVVATAHGGEIANTATNASASEDLGSDIYNGKSYKIVSVVSVTPTHVQVRYEGNFGGRKIPRKDLPLPLAAKYPYDAEKAAEFERNEAVKAAQQRAAQAAAFRASLDQKERNLIAEIARMEDEERNLSSKQTINKSLTRGEKRRNAVADNVAERKKVQDRIAESQKKLDAVRAQKDALP